MDICRIIIERIANKNPADNRGFTPLHNAAKWGYLDIMRLIIGHVEDKYPVNNDGKTPKDLAMHYFTNNGPDLEGQRQVSKLFES